MIACCNSVATVANPTPHIRFAMTHAAAGRIASQQDGGSYARAGGPGAQNRWQRHACCRDGFAFSVPRHQGGAQVWHRAQARSGGRRGRPGGAAGERRPHMLAVGPQQPSAAGAALPPRPCMLWTCDCMQVQGSYEAWETIMKLLYHSCECPSPAAAQPLTACNDSRQQRVAD